MDRVRIVVVGAGYVAAHHLAALRSLDFVDVVAVCDLDLQAAAELAQRFGVPRSARGLDELQGERVDAVYVLTPPASHVVIARQAMVLLPRPHDQACIITSTATVISSRQDPPAADAACRLRTGHVGGPARRWAPAAGGEADDQRR